MTSLTLGSLFDGSGAFPLAAKNVGITPLWASEIEPLPILVTSVHLPEVTHLGNIFDLDGAAIPPVDVITGGSPCQNLSAAGRRDGLEGDKSSLFFQQIRVTTEMREKTDGLQPRYAIWENVTGALSSNQGRDFRQVLQSFINIKAPGVHVPQPPGWKWNPVGYILGNDFSVAWRTVDSKFWGVPQSRNRIFLVCDFDGHNAGKILFDPSRMPVLGENNPRPASRVHAGTPSRHEAYRTVGTSARQTVKATTVANIVTTKPDISPCTFIKPAGQSRLRYFTEVELARLQGFPDCWVDGLTIKNPTPGQVAYWTQVWNRWKTATGNPTTQTETQTQKWLAQTDRYIGLHKMWGNGITLPIVQWILGNLQHYHQENPPQIGSVSPTR
ncbi:DNA cytosine methyltransferase [Mobiluncus curtisii]|uniref:DNA cytosine methyltransferase n=1 Tax=Mobiluncus curtisii TaxID=2051 RepID=UPI0014708330|nr:DNA cytosine methyltransferase [Mobiluncus curtisii]MCU9986714.1 DNA (cytosine-5-)-methyltransferase [Mobiluncus curtisii]MCV0020110.1 DNA (cytosine-5-)-methyltransferase [Mobiluncus curtisii]NMX12719.1 DNA (cytosine-5-)-methyltransferase [Mobiluncus curtisii]